MKRDNRDPNLRAAVRRLAKEMMGETDVDYTDRSDSIAAEYGLSRATLQRRVQRERRKMNGEQT